MSEEWKYDAGEWKWETASKGQVLRMGLAQNLEELSLKKMGLAQKWDCGICQATDRLHLSLATSGLATRCYIVPSLGDASAQDATALDWT